MLLESIAAGEKAAMHLLYARHNVRVYRFILRIIGDTSVAEDVVSDVFLDVWRRADQFEGRSQVSTWLLAIARYKALSQMRRRTVDHLDEEAAHAVEDSADSPHDVLEQKDRGALLRKALMQLSTIHRRHHADPESRAQGGLGIGPGTIHRGPASTFRSAAGRQ